MRYFHLEIEEILPAIAGAPPAIVHAWLMLLAWASKETTYDDDGYIEGCGGRIQHARITLNDEIERGALRITRAVADLIMQGDNPPFWCWKGDCLHVGLYPFFSEKAYYRQARLNAQKARKRWDKKNNTQ